MKMMLAIYLNYIAILKLCASLMDEIALGYRLLKSTWGKGYATEVSQELVLNGFAQWGSIELLLEH